MAVDVIRTKDLDTGEALTGVARTEKEKREAEQRQKRVLKALETKLAAIKAEDEEE